MSDSTRKALAEVPLSVLDLATVPQGSAPAEAFRRSAAVARRVEGLGFQRFWIAEHHNLDGIASAATAVLIGHVAGNTERIRVGAGGIMLPNHAPLAVAEQFGTLEALYPGRIDLGLGRAPGTDGETARALRARFGPHEPEFDALLEELRYYLAPAEPGQRVRAVPGAGSEVPLWLLGSGHYSAQLAAHLGLPFAFASHFAPQNLHDALALYRHHFRPSRWLERPYAMVGVNVVAADSQERAEYLATSLQQRFLRMIRNRRGPLDPPVESMDVLWDRREAAMVRAQLSASAIGDGETVRDRLQALIDETGADELIVNCDTFALEDRLRAFEVLADAWRGEVGEPAADGVGG
ncbi:LLM class flavin-dependent oxidoreductase [Arhodomonas sp. SL1]|uniref:LLM class flavin-dependent oxidoreductase n=1 Tax=Arhodomonas sp. SL1 TaxID=3425691 RepID=UPI003F883A3F